MVLMHLGAAANYVKLYALLTEILYAVIRPRSNYDRRSAAGLHSWGGSLYRAAGERSVGWVRFAGASPCAIEWGAGPG